MGKTSSRERRKRLLKTTDGKLEKKQWWKKERKKIKPDRNNEINKLVKESWKLALETCRKVKNDSAMTKKKIK